MSVQFVGHPLVDLIRTGQDRAAFLHDRGLEPDAPTVALLPGSRRNELNRIVPVVTRGAATDSRARARRAVRRGVCAGMPDDLFAPLVNDSERTASSSCAIAPTTCWRRVMS